MSDPIVKLWFTKALEMKLDSEIVFGVLTKKEAKRKIKELDAERERYKVFDPVSAAQFTFFIRLDKEGVVYVCIRRRHAAPLVGLMKEGNSIAKVEIETDLNAHRMIHCMVQDGLTISEIEANLGRPLTDVEKEVFKL